MSAAAVLPVGYMPMPANFQYRALFLHGRPHHQKYDAFWRKHPPMNITHRAKIFSAFDALAGFDDCVAGKEVLYSDRPILSEGEREELNRKLSVLQQLTCNGKAARKNRPQITVQYFSPCTDTENFAYGTGGTCKTLSGTCRKVDPISGTITVEDTALLLDDLIGVEPLMTIET